MSEHRHERLLDEGLLEEVELASEAIVALWERAIEEWRGATADARLSNTIRARLAYTAGFQLATAVLRASGLRVRGSAGRHHWATFYALRGFDDSDFDRWGATFDGHRELETRTDTLATPVPTGRASYGPRVPIGITATPSSRRYANPVPAMTPNADG